MSLTLYYHPLASFCHKVLIALYENGTEFERSIIDLGDKVGRAELQALWPFCKFPVVRDYVRKRDLAETTVIIEYLDRFFGGERPQISGDWDDALEVRLWDRLFDSYVQGPMTQIGTDRISGAQGNMTSQRATLATAYGMIDRRIASRTWVAGQHSSMADCAAAPALFYASAVQPIQGEFSHPSAYFDRLLGRLSFKRVIEDARPYFSLYPFADAIPKRFR